MEFYQLPPTDLMVVLDDMALPGGKIRMRPGGSSGGHNGLADIERMLGTNQYPRLRIGIDPPPPVYRRPRLRAGTVLRPSSGRRSSRRSTVRRRRS